MAAREFGVGSLGESAERWLAAQDAGTPIDTVAAEFAATVMLVRGEPLEVFMFERAATMDFAASTWVFPGGRVDPGDAGVDPRSVRLPDGGLPAWARRCGVDEQSALSVLVGALREVFEEAGVLFACDASGALVDTTGEHWQRRRVEVEAHEVSFTEAVTGLTLRGDLLAPVDRWVTPVFEPRRFDTWFFVACLPDGADAQALSRESSHGAWVEPQAMLRRHDDGQARLLPPTRVALERFAGAAGGADALTRALGTTFEATRPVLVRTDAGPVLRAEVNP